MSTYGVLRRRRQYGQFALPEFSGGLNLRDAATELELNESPDMKNVTLDERGGIVKRLGYPKWNANAAANLITYGYYSRVADMLLWYSAADGKLYSDPGTGVFTLRRTWTAGSGIAIVDFAGKVYANHATDGLYSSTDGVTWTIVTAATGTVAKGGIMTVWTNKLWIANGTLLAWCAVGDPTKWATGDGGGTNNLREGADGEAPITALFGATGVDFQGDPSLVAFKATSTHRVTNSTLGAYVTIDSSNGAGGPLAVTSAYGRIYSISNKGIFETDGFTPLVPVGGKLDPQFLPSLLDYSKQAAMCAGTQAGRVYFSINRANASANNLVLEYNVAFRAFTARSDAAACYVSYTKSADTLLVASPSVTGQVYRLNSGGTDDGAAITSWFLTRVVEIYDGLEARVQKVNVKMRGTVNCQLLTDFATTGTQHTLMPESQAGGGVWDTDAWDTFVWGSGDRPEDFVSFYPRDRGTAFQFRFDETSSATAIAPPLLESGAQQTVGAWALYGLNGSFSPLSTI